MRWWPSPTMNRSFGPGGTSARAMRHCAQGEVLRLVDDHVAVAKGRVGGDHVRGCGGGLCVGHDPGDTRCC